MWGRGYPEDYRLWHASTSESVDFDWQMIATGEHNSSSCRSVVTGLLKIVEFDEVIHYRRLSH